MDHELVALNNIDPATIAITSSFPWDGRTLATNTTSYLSREPENLLISVDSVFTRVNTDLAFEDSSFTLVDSSVKLGLGEFTIMTATLNVTH